MNKILTTPILFLIFNRPETAAKVFAQIRQARPRKLYVAADGPRPGNKKDELGCRLSRELIRKVDWPCTVKTLYREENLGCRIGVSSAINWFFSQEPEGIILEDDCLPNQSFFTFCSAMLERYRDDQRVMMVSGTNYLLDYQALKTDYFFSRHSVIWGWATWARAWQQYDVSISSWPDLKKAGALRSVTNNYFARKNYEQNFDLILEGFDTWDIQWGFCCLFNDGLSVVPKWNLISNIGVTGTHATQVTCAHFYQRHAFPSRALRHPVYITPDSYFDDKLHNDKSRQSVIRRAFYRRLRGNPLYRLYKQGWKKWRT